MLPFNKSITILGGGQIGSRHLQAIALLQEPIKIYVMDPSKEALLTCQTRFNQIPGNEIHSLELKQSISDLPTSTELVIVSTSSGVRRMVLDEFLSSHHCRWMILEKFLFPQLADYEYINGLLLSKNIKAWVNCNMRTFSFFQSMSHWFHPSQKTILKVMGPAWGLGCNAVHFIDLFLYWTQSNSCSVTESFLKEPRSSSKRVDYVDFDGELLLRNEKEDLLQLVSTSDGSGPITLQIKNGSSSWEADILVDTRKVVIRKMEDSLLNTFSVGIPKQSEHTHRQIEEIWISGKSSLPSWEMASKYHQVVLREFLKKLNTPSPQQPIVSCPIT